ncbi:MAG: M15 family metallopeptidase [Chitinophagales bacterium]|nr:M15 family metallopeptidase [Bacteroidota bacterium]
MKLPAILAGVVILLFGCNQQDAAPEKSNPEIKASKGVDSTLEKSLQAAGLVNVQSVIPEIQVELKYSTTDNFLHADVYGDLTNAYLQKDVVEKLKAAYQFLQETHPNLTFIIYDAVRPLSIQYKMWEILDLPPGQKEKYLSNPKNGSIHNYGAAIDMSLAEKNGNPLDMGTPFDFFGEAAEPQLEYKMLQEGLLTQQQIDNRKILRSVMQKAGFRQLPAEWWHYNSCSREEAKIKYAVI